MILYAITDKFANLLTVSIDKDHGCLLKIHLKKRGDNDLEITPSIRLLNISTYSDAENLTVVK